jgi:ABC-type transport system involved in cytochrome c biogenesis permease subunit
VTISIGYAGCCAAGLLGHIYLLQALRRAPTDSILLETYRAVFGLLAFGLIFSFVGTMLGGVWADQSWGRFWGWDPKENGALVIVLWSAVLFHARAGRMIGNLGFAAGSIFGVIAVLLAWLGVNLLGVGLHSYGFTSGIARGLFLACMFEIVYVAALVPFAKRNGPTTAG